jgi:dihydroxy-acid dehydratase
MEDLHEAGGVPAVKIFIEARIIAWRLFNSHWKTLAENLAIVPDLNDGQEVIHEIQKSIKSHRKYSNFIGNLAEEGCVAKISGNEGEYFEGDAIVYENEYDVITGVRGEVKPGNVVVIRYCGPKGGPGMPEMLKPTSAIMGAGLGKV